MEAVEYEVAGILVDFPYLIAKSESLSRLKCSLKWGVTRKRSGTAASTSTSTPPPPTTPPPPPPSSSFLLPPSLQQSQPSVPVAVLVGPIPTPTTTTTTCETEKEKRRKALSPTTPLLSLPSEPDENPQKPQSKRNVSLKRKRERHLKIVEEMTESNRILREEKEVLLSYMDREEATRLKLKAKLEEMERRRSQQPLPFDLNVPPLEECSPMESSGKSNGNDDARSLAAQARRRRIQIWRSKSRNNKLRGPFCK